MHELGTVLYVIERVEELAEKNQLSQIGSVTLEVGEVSGIVPAYLTDCWQWAVKRSERMNSAELKIEILPAVTFCENCEKTYETVKYGRTCPNCGSDKTYLLTGNEYNIKEIEAC